MKNATVKSYPPVKVSEMEFLAQNVPGNKFKLTLSNATKQIRFKIPDEASAAETVRVSNFIRNFLDKHIDYPVQFSLRGSLKVKAETISLNLGTRNEIVLTYEE